MVAQRSCKALVHTLHHRLRTSDTGQTMLKARTAVPDVICSSRPWLALTLALALVLTACGGGGGSSSDATAGSGSQVSYPASDDEARRFLTQATFGPTDELVAEVKAKGYGPWIAEQMAIEPINRHAEYFEARDLAIKASNPSSAAWFNEVNHSFWFRALTGEDQLRQRVAFALSEIFVVSGTDGCGSNNPKALAHYLDMLGEKAFGSFRVFLESVAMHPVMGCYLSSLRNQRENPETGRVPDENFAREIMQLFTIGLYQLNADGTLKVDANGNPIETYGPGDVSGLAKVFTGFSWDCPYRGDNNCFLWGNVGGKKYDDMWMLPMYGYQQYHSNSEKKFLGLTIQAVEHASPTEDLKTALDLLALTHPNVGPFIGKQLIQRLVTSNPSPAYVRRVSAAFEANGRSLGAMIVAILLDPEARDHAAALTSPTFGKVREPLLKLSAFLRAVGTTSDSGLYQIDTTEDITQLFQAPLKSPSVFNFFRPGYVFPGGKSAELSLVAPELQISNEASVASYANFMRDVISSGAGRYQANGSGVTRKDVRMSYSLNATNDWYLLAREPDAALLVDLINAKLMYGSMSQALRSEIKAAVESIPFSSTPTEGQTRNRLHAALLLTVASPEFQVQR
jgi:uncharacterized protein (DUF1800 family)